MSTLKLARRSGTTGTRTNTPTIAYCVEVYGINASRTLWLATPEY